MPNVKTEKDFAKAKIIARKIGRALSFLINGISLAVVAIMPFILIEDQDKPEFWYSVGSYGVFLMGLAALINLFSSTRSRF